MRIFDKMIVWVAYLLDNSKSYRAFKRFFRRLMNDDTFVLKHYFDAFIIALIFLSVFVLVREVRHPVNPDLLYFNNYIISAIFLVEYLLRLWVHDDIHKVIIAQYERDLFLQRRFSFGEACRKIFAQKWAFIRSPQAIIDLLAVVPFFHEFRIFRIFVLFRVFKIFRYTRRIQNLISILAVKKFELMTLLMFVATVVFISTILIYVIEARNPHTEITTLYQAFYWTIVTISTVGFGDVVPLSDEGRAVAVIIILISVSVLSFTTSIIVSAFSQKLEEIKEHDNIEKSVRLKNLYLLCGWGRVTHITASRLKKEGKHFIILDSDETAVSQAQKHGFLAFALDPTRLATYHRLEIDLSHNVRAVLCLYDSDIQNIYISLSIRALDPKVPLISLLKEAQNEVKMRKAGVGEIIHPQNLVGKIAREFGGKPVAFEVIHALRSEHEGARIEEFYIDDLVLNRFETTDELEYKRFHLILMGIQRGNTFLFRPEPDSMLEEGDILVFIGEHSLLREFDRFVRSRRSRR
ncbi:MAG: potassium transporter TrkA [Sulfurospirillum sp.]|nr:MAG: potassium transporter TrkA [Sulfurospirillum sp.]